MILDTIRNLLPLALPILAIICAMAVIGECCVAHVKHQGERQ